jgi:hypothetical protein
MVFSIASVYSASAYDSYADFSASAVWAAPSPPTHFCVWGRGGGFNFFFSSHKTKISKSKTCLLGDSNSRPLEWEADALSTELNYKVKTGENFATIILYNGNWM